MRSITKAIFLLALALLPPASEPSTIQAQSTTPVRPGALGNPGQRSTAITGEVERAGAQLQLTLTNQNNKQEFRGVVSVGVVSYLAASFVVNRGGCTEAAAVIRP